MLTGGADEIKQIQQQIDQIVKAVTATTLGSISTTGMADQALADAENQLGSITPFWRFPSRAWR
jgi:hypothetical protein